MELRMTSTMFFGFCCSMCWILYLLLNKLITVNVTAPKNSKNMSVENIYRYFLSPIPERLVFCIAAVIYSFTDGQSHMSYPDPGEYVYLLALSICYSIILDDSGCEPTPLADEHLCPGVFRLADIQPLGVHFQ
ncbi:hypothetical protein HPG69_007227 [Diceros bicornis minor]|uniref:Uncharacterized protein n=1 Tax=Diceros bicornis minor TaxID=77932 RepID=A0A7J7FP50_DICBM|nr:hypothetical protein HPG69_007227 [Diceros bicornis minor]